MPRRKSPLKAENFTLRKRHFVIFYYINERKKPYGFAELAEKLAKEIGKTKQYWVHLIRGLNQNNYINSTSLPNGKLCHLSDLAKGALATQEDIETLIEEEKNKISSEQNKKKKQKLSPATEATPFTQMVSSQNIIVQNNNPTPEIIVTEDALNLENVTVEKSFELAGIPKVIVPYGFFKFELKNNKQVDNTQDNKHFFTTPDMSIAKFQKIAKVNYVRGKYDCEELIYLMPSNVLTKESKVIQWQVVAKDRIPANEIIAEVTGKFYDKPVPSDEESAYLIPIAQGYWDTKTNSNFVSRVNHAKNPNTKFVYNEQGEIFLLTLQNIEMGEHLTVDYGSEYPLEEEVFFNKFLDWRSTSRLRNDYLDVYDHAIYRIVALDSLINTKRINQDCYYLLTNLTVVLLSNNREMFRQLVANKNILDLPVLANKSMSEVNLYENWEFEFTTVLMIACHLGMVEAVKDLLSQKADPNIPQTFSGQTALHITLLANIDNDVKQKIIEILCQNGANLCLQDKDYNNALHRAIFTNQLPLVEQIVGFLTDEQVFYRVMFEKNKQGLTPILLAIKQNNLEILIFMLEWLITNRIKISLDKNKLEEVLKGKTLSDVRTINNLLKKLTDNSAKTMQSYDNNFWYSAEIKKTKRGGSHKEENIMDATDTTDLEQKNKMEINYLLS